jgi:hypothetical protein
MISVLKIPEKTGHCLPVYAADIVSDTFIIISRKMFGFNTPEMMNLVCWFTDVDRF